jgi:hypothetical protein
MTTTTELTPHVAEVIEPGAILYSSWGYDQTNVDYYMVTRTTKASAWIVPMTHREDPAAGYSPMSGMTTPLEPQWFSDWCECKHRVSNHGDYGCRGAYGDECECKEAHLRPIKPAMHRINRSYRPEGVLSLTSFSHASLWDGASKYASHYA